MHDSATSKSKKRRAAGPKSNSADGHGKIRDKNPAETEQIPWKAKKNRVYPSKMVQKEDDLFLMKW